MIRGKSLNFGSIYNEAVEGLCLYNNRLDTYGQGCSHDCSYCYAKALLQFRGLWHPNNPKPGNVREIYKVIATQCDSKIPTRLGGMTDCFQPAEKIHKVTYHTLKAFNKMRKPYLLLTKSDLIATDEYIEVLDKDLAHIQITLTTTNDEICAKYEKATRPSDRIKAIEKLQRLGYDVQIRLSPYIPGLADPKEYNKIKCDKILIEFLRVNHWIKKWFGEFINDKDYPITYQGYQHMTFERKKELVKDFTIKEITVCDFDRNHLDYWKKEYNPNPNDCCNLRGIYPNPKKDAKAEVGL